MPTSHFQRLIVATGETTSWKQLKAWVTSNKGEGRSWWSWLRRFITPRSSKITTLRVITWLVTRLAL